MNKKLIGGVDVVNEMVEKNTFLDLVPEKMKFGNTKKEFQNAVKNYPIVILTNKENKALELLNSKGVNYKFFDCYEDDRFCLIFKLLFQTDIKEAVIINGVYVGGTEFLLKLFK